MPGREKLRELIKVELDLDASRNRELEAQGSEFCVKGGAPLHDDGSVSPNYPIAWPAQDSQNKRAVLGGRDRLVLCHTKSPSGELDIGSMQSFSTLEELQAYDKTLASPSDILRASAFRFSENTNSKSGLRPERLPMSSAQAAPIHSRASCAPIGCAQGQPVHSQNLSADSCLSCMSLPFCADPSPGQARRKR